jgi:MFS family permease
VVRRAGPRRLTATAPPSTPDRHPLRSLRERNARIFFAGLWVSTVGTWAHNTAVVLLVRELGGDGLELGIAAACQFAPMLLFGLHAGAIADQADRHRRLARFSMLLAALALALGGLVLGDAVNMFMVYAMTLLFGLASAFENPTRRSFVTELVPANQVGNVLSLNTTVMTSARMVGPAMAAVVAGATSTGLVFIINGVTYLAVLLSLRFIDRDRLHRYTRAAKSATPVRDGLRAIWSIPELRFTLPVFAIVSTFAYNYAVGLPLLVSDRLEADPSVYGWLLSVMSFGNVTGALVIARLDRIRVQFVLAAGLLLGAALAWVSFMTSLGPMIAAVFAFGMATAAFANSSTIIVQQRIDPSMRSRGLALTSVLFIGSTPIGAPITGVIGDALGARWANLYGALISIFAAGVAWLLLARHTARRDRAVPDGND